MAIEMYPDILAVIKQSNQISGKLNATFVLILFV